MKDSLIETLRLEIMIEAQKADATVEGIGKKIKILASESKTSFKSVSDAIKEMFKEQNGGFLSATFSKLISRAEQYAVALDRAEKTQARLLNAQMVKGQGIVDAGIASQNSEEQARNLARLNEEKKAQGILDAKIAKENADARLRQEQAEKQLNSEMVKGQAIIDADIAKKNADKKAQDALNLSLKNGTATNAQYAASLKTALSAATMGSLGGIKSTDPVNPMMVAKIKAGMEEIVQITGLNANKVKAILGTMFTNIPVQGLDKATKDLSTSLGQVETKAKNAGGGLWGLNNIARTVLGTFTAMAVFFVTQFIGQAIKKSIESIQQLEKAMLNLSIAEKSLSRDGVEIVPEDFDKIAEAVRATGIAISKIDLANLIANTASGTRDLKLSVKQLQDLSVATVAIAYANGKTVEEIQNTIQTSLTTSGRGLKPLDIPVNDAIIKEKAIEAQLVKNAEAYERLTEVEKQKVETDALLLIITDNANQILSETGVLSGSVTEKARDLSASWEDVLTTFGELTRPIIVDGLSMIVNQLQRMNTWLEKNEPLLRNFVALISGVLALQERLNSQEPTGFDKFFKFLTPGLAQLREYLRLAKEMPGTTKAMKDAYEEALRSFDDFDNSLKNEPTGTPPPSNGGEEVDTDLAEALDKMNQEIIEAQIKFAQDMEEIHLDMERKMFDITQEYAKKRAEAEMAYNNQVIDINIDYDNKLADLNAKIQDENDKARQRELERERNFQNKMKELKEDFLMDLEDALHARDARQILRLIKQYELEKKQAERQHALDKKNAQEEDELRKKQLERERQQIEIERQRKLEEAARDLQLKLTALAADEEAERAAATLAAQRKQEDLEREIGDRLELIAAKLVEEYNLTEQGLQSILNLYMSYYGQIGGIWTAMMSMLTGMGGAAIPPPDPHRGRRAFAEGGTMVANRPTTVTFGEAGMEMATFTPIGRTGRDVNKMFSSLGNTSGNGAGGKVSIELLLSPDLESKIVNNTLNQTAEVFTRTLRTKR